ncbi:MAG: DUF2914 domain-containing protein [Vicinamibacteria bacterium]
MKRAWTMAAVAAVAMTMAVQGQERRVFPGPMPNLPFSAAVRADGLIYLAGALSQEGGDIRVQTRKVLEDMDKTLRAAGSRLANVASVNVYLTRAEDFAAMNEVYRAYWPKDPPTRTTVITDLLLGALVERGRALLPPAPLQIALFAFGTGIDQRTVQVTGILDAPPARARRVYVLTHIIAPLGLEEGVRHRWFRDDVLFYASQDYPVRGGRETGYRLWTYATPGEGVGRVRVDVETAGGQLIGRVTLP